MTAAAYVPGKATALQVTISSVLTTIDKVQNVKVPLGDVQMTEQPSLDSGTGIPMKPTGFVKPEKVTGKLWCDPGSTVHAFLVAKMAAPAVIAWAVLYQDSATTTAAFNGTLTKFEIVAETEKGLEADFEIMPDGLVTLS